jgi:Leucine-rich repeat (LRR) protein
MTSDSFLGHNNMRFLPDGIGKLTALEILDLQDTSLNDLPDALGDLKALNILLLVDIPATSLPDSVRQLEDRGCIVEYRTIWDTVDFD